MGPFAVLRRFTATKNCVGATVVNQTLESKAQSPLFDPILPMFCAVPHYFRQITNLFMTG